MLDEFVSVHRNAIAARMRAMLVSRQDEAIEVGVLRFLEDVVSASRTVPLSSQALEIIGRNAAIHGAQLLRTGFSLADVVHCYASVGRVIRELAAEASVPLVTEDLRVLQRCLDEATAQAVTEHARRCEQSRTDEERERLGEFAHELRGSIGSAMISFDLLRGGTAGFGGSTAGVLGRSLGRLSSLVESSVARVRLGAGILAPERVSVRQFIEEVEIGASIEATARDVTLGILPVEPGVDVQVDRPLLAAAVGNLLTNAFKFTRPKGRVLLRASSARGRVFIEVEDECGGLPPGQTEALFQPFEQRGANRAGLGLGLSLSRRGVEANGGRMSVRDVPGTGCVFMIDLPQLPGAV